MVPVGQCDDSRLVVDIVKARMRIVGVVDNESTTKAVAVLGRQMAVVPEGACISISKLSVIIGRESSYRLGHGR